MQTALKSVAPSDCRVLQTVAIDGTAAYTRSSHQSCASISQEAITGLRHTHRRALVRESGMPMHSAMS